MRRLVAHLRRPDLRLERIGRIVLGAALLAASARAGPEPVAPPERPGSWSDAALGYLLRTPDEFPPAAALFLRAAAQVAADERALAVAEIRGLGFLDAELDGLAPLLGAELTLFEAALEPKETGSERPAPDPRNTGVPATPPAADAPRGDCLASAARCELEPRCVAAAQADDTVADPARPALWLLFVRWRRCPTGLDVDELASRLAGRLLVEQRRDGGFSTTALLRLATLGQLGYADRFDPAWVQAVLDARSAAGCWGSTADAPCHPHPTALALWVLALAEQADGGAARSPRAP